MRQIAQELGLSRNTVRKYLRASVEEIEALQRESAREKGLDAHREFMAINTSTAILSLLAPKPA